MITLDVSSCIVTKPKEARKRVELAQLSDFIEEFAQRAGDGPANQAMFAVLKMAQKVINDQTIEIFHLEKQLFGQRSEKVSRDQLSLFALAVGTIADKTSNEDSGDAPGDDEPSKQYGSKKEKKKRRPLQPTRTEEILVPAEERPCPECGGDRCKLEPVRSMVVEYTPPKVEVIEYLREKLVCRACEGELTTAPVPKERVIDRALPGPNMLSALVVNKVVDGIPLQHSRKIFKRAGVDLPATTLSRWEGFAHQLLEPVIQRLKTRVLEADTINLDDTSIRVRDPTEEGGVFNGHIWVYVGRKFDPGGDLSKTQELLFYQFAPTWEAKHPEAFLDGCTATIQGDAYRGYERIASPNHGDRIGKVLAGCCMHARRPFAQAFESKDPSAVFFIERFQALYRIEAKARDAKLLADARLELRKRESLPVMRDILERAKALSDGPLFKPMKMGVTYFVNQWEKLIVPFTLDGRLEIDNGTAERWIRPVASGRKRWLFAGSRYGAHRFAEVLSLASSADVAGISPGTYLPSILSHVDSWPQSRIDDLLPYRWKELRAQAFLEERHQ